jgi:SsrA-binding protein
MTGEKVLITNKKAFRDYTIEAKYEAGIELRGTEVKSLRQDGGNLTDCYARIEDGEVYLYHFNINPYQFGNINNHDPKRRKKLLLHKNEIRRLTTKIEERGYTLVPTRIYFKNGKVKVEVGLGKGKKLYDKREDIKEKDAQRSIEQAMKQRNKE